MFRRNLVTRLSRHRGRLKADVFFSHELESLRELDLLSPARGSEIMSLEFFQNSARKFTLRIGVNQIFFRCLKRSCEIVVGKTLLVQTHNLIFRQRAEQVLRQDLIVIGLCLHGS